MARMKFLCDADRCIECNACVTACKNENEVPWGINRRRVVTINDGKPGERSVSMACMHCTDAPCAAVCPVNCFYTTADGVVLHSKDLCIGCGYCFYACPFGAPQYPRVGNFGSRGKMDKCTYCAGGPEADGQRGRIRRNTAATDWPRASCRSAPRCAPPNRCSPATARSSRRSTRSACCSADTARARGVGRRLTRNPSRCKFCGDRPRLVMAKGGPAANFESEETVFSGRGIYWVRRRRMTWLRAAGCQFSRSCSIEPAGIRRSTASAVKEAATSSRT